MHGNKTFNDKRCPKPLMARLRNSVRQVADSSVNLQFSQRSAGQNQLLARGPGVHGNRKSHGKPYRSQAPDGKATK